MKTVATFNKAEEAHLLRMRLEDAGIEAFVQGENTVQSSNALGGIRVEVADEDVEAVGELLGGEDGIEPGTAGAEAPPSFEETYDSPPEEGKGQARLYAGAVLLLVGIPLLFAVFHFHDFVNYVQNEQGGEDITSKNARIRVNNAAADLVNRGAGKRRAGDVDGAIADYNSALKLNPDDIYAYVDRGVAENIKGDFKSAMADYDKAIQLNPDHASAYANRGLLKNAMGDANGAMVDYDKAIMMVPDNGAFYQYRGHAKNANGDTDGALADYDKAIELNKPPKGSAFHNRGCLLFDMRKFSEALADFRKASELGLTNVLDNDYPHFRIYLVRALMNENAAATEELQAYLSKRKEPEQDWTLKIGRFLGDQMPEVDFIDAATDANENRSKQKQCEAWFYAGMKHLIAGDKATAQDDFKKCVATGMTMDYEYASAAACLKFLEGQ